MPNIEKENEMQEQKIISNRSGYIYSKMETDSFYQMEKGAFKTEGYLDKAIKFVEEFQLMDEELWKIFVNLFRKNADDVDNGWRAEFWGKTIRGATLIYQYTLNQNLYCILENSVRDLLTTQDSLGRISTYSIKNEFKEWDMWGRKYILLGLQYFLDICKDEQFIVEIINAMCRHTDYIIERIGMRSEGKIPINEIATDWMGISASSILEPIVRLYKITNNDKYLKFAHEIVECGGAYGFDIFEAAYKGELNPFEYPVTKAYELMSCFEGLLEYYRITKIEKWRIAALNFANLVINSDITIIGSAGCTHELFDNAKIKQFDPDVTGIMQETCVTATWMKLCYNILSLTGEMIFAEEIEKSLNNALFGAINFEKGTFLNQVMPFDSYSPLRMSKRGVLVGGRKIIQDERFYGCCAAIGSVGLGIAAYYYAMLKNDGIVINTYMSGYINTTTPSGQELTLKIDTEYPRSGIINISILVKTPEKFSIDFIIPTWSEQSQLLINGQKFITEAGTYASVNRVWKQDDCVILSLDMSIRLIKASEINPRVCDEVINHFAIMSGPIVLSRDSRIDGDEIFIPLKINGLDEKKLIARPTNTTKFNTRLEYEIMFDKSNTIKFIDYSSAGLDWGENSFVTTWIPYEEI